MIEYAVIVLTPGVLEDGIEKEIIDALVNDTAIEILFRKYWHIREENTIFAMYPQLITKPFRHAIVRVMTRGKCVFLLVRGEDAYCRLRMSKGEFKFSGEKIVKVDGLRLKYRPKILKNDDVGARFDKTFDFRIHTTDNLAETISLCLLCLSPLEIDGLSGVAQDFYLVLRNITNNIV